jgi:hypothetical protein
LRREATARENSFKVRTFNKIPRPVPMACSMLHSRSTALH